ncbi:DUF3800 domain-containing protein [Aneurinibacillus thermoaerophilus]|uniref:DUF3800 domain-containing protein n=1 Tax=Aneurinibacillus thermoaerophilus TaxID=143495 RepID=UPI002E1F0618|nr:DUF3800 domain-containing protein [Aneurinibacillus thermoaerophilus]
MYFVFIDEAGTPGYKKGKTPDGYFTLAGMIVKGENILKLERELQRHKLDYGLPPQEEFKWGSKYSSVGWSYDEYANFREGVFQIIENLAETIIGVVLDKGESYKKNYINDHCDLYQQALYLMMERINMWYEDTGVIAAPTIFVIDSRKNNKEADLDEKLAKSFRGALRTGTYYHQGFPWFSHSPFFSTSEESTGLQLADYCAGPIQQYFSTGKDEWYQKMRGKIRKSPGGKVSGYGIKTFPGRPTIQL